MCKSALHNTQTSYIFSNLFDGDEHEVWKEILTRIDYDVTKTLRQYLMLKVQSNMQICNSPQ